MKGNKNFFFFICEKIEYFYEVLYILNVIFFLLCKFGGKI